jgi:hypothetical protein
MARARRIARWARFVLGVLFLIGIVVQFLGAGYGLFADPGNFHLHVDLGWTLVHWLPVLIFLAGLLVWRPLTELALSVAIGVLGFVQPLLAHAGDWAGLFHPLNALVLFLLTYRLADRDWRTLRRAELPAAAEARAAPTTVS